MFSALFGLQRRCATCRASVPGFRLRIQALCAAAPRLIQTLPRGGPELPVRGVVLVQVWTRSIAPLSKKRVKLCAPLSLRNTLHHVS